FSEYGTDRKLVDHSAIDARYGDRSAFAACMDGLAQWFKAHAMRLHADGFDAGIGPAPSRHFLQGFENVHLVVIDRLRATVICRFAQTRLDAIDGDHALGPEHECALHGQ